MPDQAPLNRREWLKAASLTVAGAVLAPRLAAAAQPKTGAAPGSRPPADPPVVAPRPSGERQYIYGFETYPPV